MTGWQKKQRRMSESALKLPNSKSGKSGQHWPLQNSNKKRCRIIQRFLTKSPINSIRPEFFATANLTLCHVASTNRNLLLKEQSLLPSRNCVPPVCNRTILFEDAQNLESATSLIATAITSLEVETVKCTRATSALRVKGLLQIVESKLLNLLKNIICPVKS